MSRSRLLDVPAVLWTAARKLYTRHGAEWAAALAYYSLLSVFPAALLGVTITATIVDEGWAVEQIVNGVGRLLPSVNHTLARDVREATEQRGRVGLVALLVLFWTGSRVFSTLTFALNEALSRPPTSLHPGLAVLREIALLVAAGAVLLLGTASGIAIEVLLQRWGLSGFVTVAVTTVTRGAFFATGIFALILWVPSPRPHWRPALLGALSATTLLVLAMPLFSAYVSRLGQYNLIYGPLAILIVILVWFWVASFLLLLGVHVTAELEAAGTREAAPATPSVPPRDDD